MAKKKTNQQEKKVQVKKKVQKRKKNTRRHVKGEIISWEELENRTGLTGDETELLTVYLHKFERGEVHVRCSKKLTRRPQVQVLSPQPSLTADFVRNQRFFVFFGALRKPPGR